MEEGNKYGVIYKITNKINGKVYIGQTIEKGGFDRRYRNNLERNTHNNHLKNAIVKYGIENFEINKEFDVGYSQDDLNQKEEYYIKLYKSTNRKYGYNKTTGGEGRKLTEEAKRNMSIAQKKYYLTHQSIFKGKRRHEYDGENNPNYNNHKLSGENHPLFGKHHSKETKKKISKSNKGKLLGEKNPWYKKGYLQKGNNNPNYGNKWTQEQKEKASEYWKGRMTGENNAKSKKIICLNTLEIFNCIREAMKKYNIVGSSDIGKVCKGILKSAGKFNGEKLVWMYLEDYLKVKNKEELINDKLNEAIYVNKGENSHCSHKIILLNELLIFNSIQEATNQYKVKSSNISQCCSGKQKSAGKHPITGEPLKWMYYEDWLKLQESNDKTPATEVAIS